MVTTLVGGFIVALSRNVGSVDARGRIRDERGYADYNRYFGFLWSLGDSNLSNNEDIQVREKGLFSYFVSGLRRPVRFYCRRA